jgi:type I restriction enzyme S subunit
MVAKDIWKRNWGGNSMEWKEVTLGEIGTIVGGATPSTKNTSFYDGNIPWLTPKDLSVNSNKYILRGERNITEAGFKSCSCKMLPKGSVLFSSRAPIGYVAITANDMCTNQGFKSVIPNEETDSEFLYYLLKYNKDNIASQGSGTTFAEVSGKTMKEIEVMVPKETDDQHRIASILSSLDRKIELNNKINADLEEMAQAIFKNWFVDLEPFKDGKFVDSELGMIPEGWKVGNIGDIVEFQNGFAFSSNDFSEYGEYKIITIKSVQDGCLLSEGSSKISEYPTKMPAYCKLQSGDILLSLTGNVGRCCLVTEPHLLLNQRVAKIKAKESFDNSFSYALFRLKETKELLISISRGTAQANLSPVEASKLPMVIPSEDVRKKFSMFSDSIMDKIISIHIENSRLSLLRDTLLPRLMSGELEVPE